LLAWRALSGLPVLVVWLWFQDRMSSFRNVLKDKRALGTLFVTAILIALNWFTFIYATVENRLSEASLGYYTCPLVSVALGRVFLGESLRPLQLVGIAFAIIGVAIPVLQLDSFPWITIVLAFSFAFYGLLRKQLYVDSITGLTYEMLFLFPLFFALDIQIHIQGDASFLKSSFVTFFMLLGGVVTIVPLVLFASAAHKLRLVTVGVMQYISPTGQFLLAVFIFGEVIDSLRWVTFGFVWLAVFLYAFDMFRMSVESSKGKVEDV